MRRQSPPRHLRGAAEAHAAALGRGDALGLAGADGFALVLRDKGEELQHQVCDKGAHQVLGEGGVQQRHVQHADIHPALLGQEAPLLENLLVVAAQPVDAVQEQQVPAPQPVQEALVLRPAEVLAALLVQEDVLPAQAQTLQGLELAGLVLVL